MCRDRMCGAYDCKSCYPYPEPEEEMDSPEPALDLSGSGYEYDPADQTWSRIISRKLHTARKTGAKHGYEPGTRYRRTTYRIIDDDTRASRLYTHYRSVSVGVTR